MLDSAAGGVPGLVSRLLAAPMLSYGFRVFFLFAGLYGVLAVAAWLAWIGLHALNFEVVGMSIALPPHLWHAHEMIFGYTLAVIAGFFLTAVPSWTGREPILGGPLALLAGAWLAARLASWSSAVLPALLVGALDLLFIALLGLMIGRALIGGGSRRNLVFLPVLAVLLIANLLVHLEILGLLDGGMARGHLLALDTILLLITAIGGRIVPAFTTNVLRNAGVEPLPRSHKPLEIAVIAAMVFLLLADLIVPGSLFVGALAGLAALAHALRLAGWRGSETLDRPILWILHLGYAWLIVGLALKAAALLGGWLSEVTALHALTVGAIGSMTIGVMSRAALGHTGRELVAPPAIVAAYVLISLAAVIRVAGPALLPAHYNGAMVLSGIAWMAAFAVFSVVFWPILTRPRVRAAVDGSPREA